MGSDTKIIDNAFICFILCSISFAFQIIDQPFLTEGLNSLNLKGNLIMMMTIYLGIFSSVTKDNSLQTLLMAVVVSINAIFFMVFAKNYILIKFALSKKKSAIISKIGGHLNRFFLKGFIYFY